MIIESSTNLVFGRVCGNRPNGDGKPCSDEDSSVAGRPNCLSRKRVSVSLSEWAGSENLYHPTPEGREKEERERGMSQGLCLPVKRNILYSSLPVPQFVTRYSV